MTEILDMSSKVCLVTGAGQGIGRQIALHFAAQGGKVAVNDYFQGRADAVAAEIRDLGGEAVGVQGDVTDHAGMKQVAATAKDALGSVNVLVNNAGNVGADPKSQARETFWKTGPEAWSSFLDVNLHGVFNSAAAVIPDMIENRDGRIITVISEASRYGDAGMEIYAAAKAGAAGFTRSVARSLGRHQVTANCIAIAATVTPAIEDRLNANPERAKKMLEKYVIRRFGQPDDVANMALFLASDASSWITGQTYPVNGGFTFNL